MADITEEKLEEEISKILEGADLKSTSAKKVRQQLEKNLGVDLSEKRSLLDKIIMDFVNKMDDDEDESEQSALPAKSSSDDYDDEEEDVKPAKRPARAAPTSVTTNKKYKKSEDEDQEEQSSNDSESEEEKEKKKKVAPKKKGGRKKRGSDGDSGSDWGQKREKAPKTKKAGGRGAGGGYTRAHRLSPALAELMGAPELPRHEVVKRVWALIKERNLYDPNNKRFAICDDALYKVIGTKRFCAFGMMKYLKSHFLDE